MQSCLKNTRASLCACVNTRVDTWVLSREHEQVLCEQIDADIGGSGNPWERVGKMVDLQVMRCSFETSSNIWLQATFQKDDFLDGLCAG